MRKDIASLIIKHTVVSRRHLTPELGIRVIDQSCPLWTAREDQSPFKDPFWAFYWPGGQAMYDKVFFNSLRTQKYILDNPKVVKNRRVLDVGCGCGASSIAARKEGATVVVANDIDPYAITATKINSEINKISIKTSIKNYIGKDCTDFDTILIGDMFYDEEFAKLLFRWLLQLSENGKDVLIGDPGRHGLTKKMRSHIELLANYKMTEDNCIENNGFTETTVWKIC